MKKIKLIVISLLLVVNFTILLFNIYNNRYVSKIENSYISMNVPKKLILKNKKYGEFDSKFRFNYGTSTVDVILLEKIPSNDEYSLETLSRSIDYQVLSKLKGYKEIEFDIDDSTSYSKNVFDDKIVEILIRYDKKKIVIISYISYEKSYDSSIIRDVDSSVKIK